MQILIRPPPESGGSKVNILPLTSDVQTSVNIT